VLGGRLPADGLMKGALGSPFRRFDSPRARCTGQQEMSPAPDAR
jgi:hypothetical protein